MPTALLKQRLGASTAMLAAERARLETEIMRMEKTMATPTDTDGMIRALKAEIDAVDAEQARKRELLEQAERQRRTLARDAAAAREAADREAIAACKARLGALLDRKGELIAHCERLARELLDTRREILSMSGEARSEAKRLGYTAVGPTDTEVLQRLSLRETQLMSQLPGCRHRYGHLVLPSGSFGLVPADLTWSEDEARYERDLRALASEEA
jgi:hypothetical protein